MLLPYYADWIEAEAFIPCTFGAETSRSTTKPMPIAWTSVSLITKVVAARSLSC